MLQMVLFVPATIVDAVLAVVLACEYAIHVTHRSGAASKPDGDVLTAIVPREAVGRLLEDLRAVGFDEHSGTIVLDERVTILGDESEDAARRAHGAPEDALLWPLLRSATRVATEFSVTYLAFMTLATMLAAIGLLISSSVLIVGAMILGPEFGALAHLCVAGIARDLRGVAAALWQLVLGFGVAIALTTVFVAVGQALGIVSISDVTDAFEQSIVSPSWIGLAIACIAGVAGMLTLTSAKGDALIGVLVSVTTIPAAAEVSLGLASLDAVRVGNGVATLVVNLLGMVIAGAATLIVLRSGVVRHRGW